MLINVVYKNINISKIYKYWAYCENEIDFFNDKESANLCTISFAITELEKYLERIINDFSFCVSNDIINDAFNIELINNDLGNENFSILKTPFGLCIEGNNRAGILYGVYEFLNLQGIEWVEPFDNGEIIPKKRDRLLIHEKQDFITTSNQGRGFALDGELNESEALALWMARHRLNSYFIRPHTNALMHKLGFKLCAGGHVFEKFLNTDVIAKDGVSIWEQHPEWYGTPLHYEKKKETALCTQFCVSNSDLLTYLGEQLIDKINGEWKDADEINIWGFDTWGETCNCDRCQKIGNGTDKNLRMMSFFRDYIDLAYKNGRINHNVKLIMCLYEGTCTIEPPINPIPENLLKAGDHCLFAPIVRCYDHYFDDESCSYNTYYFGLLSKWNKIDNRLPISILEYYNVTKFEDMPLLFLKTMKHDFEAYFKLGVQGYNYMHIPMVNWGVRALTQHLYAALSWNYAADTNKIIDTYFNSRYQRYADSMKDTYLLIDKASSLITSWRSWKDRSVLFHLQMWDGGVPTVPFEVDDHLKTFENALNLGNQSIELLENALSKIESLIKEEKTNLLINPKEIKALNNPDEILKQNNGKKVLNFLLDDKRGLVYGISLWKMIIYVLTYYVCLMKDDEESAEKAWDDIENYESVIESYYMPIKYTNSTISIISHDMMTRSQLKETIQRCRTKRNHR